MTRCAYCGNQIVNEGPDTEWIEEGATILGALCPDGQPPEYAHTPAEPPC